MLSLKSLTLAILISAPAAHAADQFEFNVDGVRKTVVSRQAPKASKNWIVYLPGQMCGTWDPANARWTQWMQENSDFGVLVINKTGSRLSGQCADDEYQHSSLRSVRIDDALFTMKSLLPPDANVFLFGESEGGYIAADVANRDPRVAAVVTVSGGSRSWLVEEMMLRPPSERVTLWRYFMRKVIGNWSFDKFFDSTTYAQLNSYHTHKTFEALERLSVPMLMLNGGRDTAVWVEGFKQDVDRLVREGKQNLEFHTFPNLAHGLGCDSGCDQAQADAQLKSTLLDFADKVLAGQCPKSLRAAR